MHLVIDNCAKAIAVLMLLFVVLQCYLGRTRQIVRYPAVTKRHHN